MPQWWELIPVDPDLAPEAQAGVLDAFRAVVTQSWTLLTKALQVCLASNWGLTFFDPGTSTRAHLIQHLIQHRIRAAPARSQRAVHV